MVPSFRILPVTGFLEGRLSSSSKGAFLPLILAGVLVGSILLLSLYETLTNRYMMTNRLLCDRMAENLCLTAVDAIGYKIQVEALDPGSALMEFFRNDASEHTDLMEYLSDVQEDLKEIASGEPGRKILYAHAWLEDTGTFKISGNEWSWSDPVERIGTLTVEVGSQANFSTRHLQVRRKFQFTNILPAVMGRFSLVVKNPDRREDPDGSGYNRFENYSDGNSMKTNHEPYRIFNNPSGGTPEKNGWIFWGGVATATFHLTSGIDTSGNGAGPFGESFHFFPLTQPSASPPFFILTENEPWQNNPWKVSGQELGYIPNTSSPYVFADILFTGRIFGFFSLLLPGSSAEETMNTTDDLLDFWFNTPSPLTMKSSILHLTGDPSNPTPTWVIGPVYRSYPLYTRASFKWFFLGSTPPADGTYDGILAYLKNPAERFWEYPESTFWPEANTSIPFIDPFENPLPPDDSVKIVVDGLAQWVRLANQWIYPAQGFGVLMGMETADPQKKYGEYCSKIILEPYNAVNSYFFQEASGAFSFPPASGSFNTFSGIADGKNFSLELGGGGLRENYAGFQGNLEKVTGSLLTYKPVYVLDQEEFGRRYVREENGRKVLSFSSSVLIDTPLAEFGPWDGENLNGFILCTGDVIIRGIGTNLDPTNSLTICALGNVTLEIASGYRVNSSVFALNGSIKHAVRGDSFGSQGVADLPWENLQRGGTLTYNANMDPTTESYPMFDRLFLADAYHQYEVKAEPFQ